MTPGFGAISAANPSSAARPCAPPSPGCSTFPEFSFETYRVLYGEDHWVLDWALISGDIRFDCLDVVVVSPDGLVARKDTFVDMVQLQAAMGMVTQ